MSHQVVWFDIPAENLERSLSFYRTVLDVEIEQSEWQGGGLGVLPHGNDDVAGCIYKTDDSKPGDQGPLIYLNVDGRLEQAVSLVEPNGGKVIQAPHSIEPHGHRAIILDSEGNRVALHSN